MSRRPWDVGPKAAVPWFEHPTWGGYSKVRVGEQVKHAACHQHGDGKRENPRSPMRTSIPVCTPCPPAIMVPATPDVMMCVVLTGNPVRPAVPMRADPISSALAPWPGVMCALPKRSPRVRTTRL